MEPRKTRKILIQRSKPKALKRILPTVIILSLIAVFSSSANTIDELKENISEKQSQLNELNAEIQDLAREVARKQRQIASLQNEIALYDLQIRQNELQIQTIELEISKLSADILETEIAIQEKIEQIEKQKTFLAETLRLIHEYDSTTPLEITLGNNTFSEFLDEVQYAANLQEKNQELLTAIKALKEELETKKAELETELARQEQLKGELTRALNSLAEQKAGKQYILTETRGQEKVYQTLLNQAAQKQEQVEREIFELEVSIRQRLGDKTLPPIEGLLRWPMSGILTQGYGKTGFTALGYSFHNGIDIAAPAGAKIYAAGDGVVFATGTGQAAYGNWVVIKHTINQNGQVTNIYTLYAHLNSFIVSAGQPVRAADVVGYEGNSGNTTRLLYGPERGYHVHFTIFDEEGFGIKSGAYEHIYGPYQIPYGYTYNPLNFLK